MSNDIEFVGGLIVKAPKDGAPDFVKANLSFKRAELIAWLQAQEGEWVNAQVKESKGGKWYCAKDDWKPKEGGERPARTGGGGSSPPSRDSAEDFDGDNIPFASPYGQF